MATPVELLSNLVVGIVESVSPNEIKVLLELDSPQATALNTGTPTAFPRINGYVLLPNEAGATVAYISWIGIERSPYPKRYGLKDFGLIDLPFPLRKMAVSPVGTLTAERERQSGATLYKLSRGVMAFPSVGDQVLMPTPEQVAAIVGANDAERRVRIGVSTLASNAEIKVDPNKLFGRHLAVLGNTGSGKSCTVAGLIRWSLEAAVKAAEDQAKGTDDEGDQGAKAPVPNARFIVLDPNGEYAKAFKDLGDHVRVFTPNDVESPFVLPAWMWNSHEWGAFTQAQPGTQKPLLVKALRGLRSGRVMKESLDLRVARQVRLYKTHISSYLADSSGAYMKYPALPNCVLLFQNLGIVMKSFKEEVEFDNELHGPLNSIVEEARSFMRRYQRAKQGQPGEYSYNAPNAKDFELFIEALSQIEEILTDVPSDVGVSEDSPIPFDVSQIADYVSSMAAGSVSGPNVAHFVSYLTERIRTMISDARMVSVIAPSTPIHFGAWLECILGNNGEVPGRVAIIDLSLLPSDVAHISVAVLGRLVFEASQRYRRMNPEGKALPTTLVLEEAHTFVKRLRQDNTQEHTAAQLCLETFERIAREGRKFGLGLVLSSQRPSELSPTVLAQCNTFLLHRIVNDSDQDLVARLVPDNVGGLLRDLPSLPSRQAILLGWATPIPVLVEIDELPKEHRPQSDDPDFWEVWTLEKKRPVNWDKIADEWSGTVREPVASDGQVAEDAN